MSIDGHILEHLEKCYLIPQSENHVLERPEDDPCHWETENSFGAEYVPMCGHPDGNGFCIKFLDLPCDLYRGQEPPDDFLGLKDLFQSFGRCYEMSQTWEDMKAVETEIAWTQEEAEWDLKREQEREKGV